PYSTSCFRRAHPISSDFSSPGPPASSDLHSFPTRRSSDLGYGLDRINNFDIASNAVSVTTEAGQYLQLDLGRVTDVHDLKLNLRSEEHTSELQSRFDLVCRLLLEKKKDKIYSAERMALKLL